MNKKNTKSKSKVVIDGVSFLVDSRYKILRTLGKGSYGTVCHAIDTKPVKMGQKAVPMAIKKISNIFEQNELLKRSLRELMIMKHFMGHKNIINLVDLDIVPTQPFEGLYCAQELMDSDLSKIIYSGIQFSGFHIQNFVYQILCGLKYIHSADVIHRDLKPGNILVNSQGTIKICDFGLARGINPNNHPLHPMPITNYVATRWYRAPEVILSSAAYSKSIDIWAVGCIVAELYGRKPLFMGMDDVDQLRRICKVIGHPDKTVLRKRNWKLPFELNMGIKCAPFSCMYIFACADAVNLLESLLLWDPDSRLTVSEAIEHTFFEKIRTPANEIECSTKFEFSFENARSYLDMKRLLEREVSNFKRSRAVPF